MILVLDNEVDPDYRYLGPEITRILPSSTYHVIVDEPAHPPIDRFEGVVLSGSTDSVYTDEHGEWFDVEAELIRRCVREHVPLLGICYGHQLVNAALGGTVKHDRRRATFVEMSKYDDTDILAGVEPIVPVLHGDVVIERGEDIDSIAQTAYDPNFCTRHRDAPIYTVQFHPEFTERVSHKSTDWNPGDYSFEDPTAVRVLENFAAIATAADSPEAVTD